MTPHDFTPETFPEDLYLDAFPDVRAAIEAGLFGGGFDHWSRHGRQEIENGLRHWPFYEPGHDTEEPATPHEAGEPVPHSPPSPLATASPDAPPYRPPSAPEGPPPEEPPFIEALYLALNPDIAEAVENGLFPSGRDHWRLSGQDEERAGLRPTLTQDALYDDAPSGTPPVADQLDAFDAETYCALYPDVAAATGGDPEAARAHWLRHGWIEGRVGPGIAPYRAMSARPGRLLARPFGLNVFGPFAATSGLGTAARGLLRAVDAAALPYAVHAFDVSRGAPRITRAERGRRPLFRINLLLANADQIARLVALYPEGTFDDAYTIAVWAWELAAFRPDWFAAFGPLDEVWTNSQFELDAIAALSPVPVRKIPLPVQARPQPAATAARARFGIPRDRLVFLVAFDVGSTSARKNPLAAVTAFRRAFAASENVFLVIKFHSNSIEPETTRALTRALRGAENVLVIADRLSDEDMAALQAACDCFVSPHRSEGYGLNIAEFLAAGKPVIATNYSGNLEFFDAEVGWPLDYRLVEIDTATGPYQPGYVWAEPDEAALVHALRAVYANQEEAWARGARGAARLRERFSHAAIGTAIRERLAEIGLAATLPPFLTWYGSARAIAGPVPTRGLPAETREALLALGPNPPVISLVTPVHNVRAEFLQACIDSVRAQTYPHWELCLADDASTDPGTLAVLDATRGTDPRIRIRRLTRNLGIAGASNAAAEMATGSFLAMLDNDDTLEPAALAAIAAAIVADPTIDALYTDEDKIDQAGQRIDTYFKPDWSPEHLESVMYVLHLMVVRKKLFLELGGFRPDYDGAQDYDLMLRVSRRARRIHHVPGALYHWRALPGSAAAQVDAKPWALEAGRRALADHVAAKYEGLATVEAGLLPGTFRVRRDIAGNPRATLLILTNNNDIELPGRRRFRMIDNLVDSILRRTAYRNYEIVVVDNSRLVREQTARLRALGVRVENYTGPTTPFNYAAKANFALRCCRTEHVVLLNDDMEIIDENWLGALLELAQDPEIGAVGARLLHADGTIQHVGQIIGVGGGAAHIYHSFPADFVGYNGYTHLIRNYAAVTGACLATRRSVLAQVGGFDESFAIDFNDTDLCLKIVEAGYRIAYTPYATLLHFEGASAPRREANPTERNRFAKRWPRYIENDPFYNPHLSRDRHDFALAEQ